MPVEEQKQVIDYMMKIDVRSIANNVMQELFRALAMKYDFELNLDSNKTNMEVLV